MGHHPRGERGGLQDGYSVLDHGDGRALIVCRRSKAQGLYRLDGSYLHGDLSLSARQALKVLRAHGVCTRPCWHPDHAPDVDPTTG